MRRTRSRLGNGRIGPAATAAQLLALLGHPEDKDRIARRGVESVWLPIPPWTRGQSRFAELMSATKGQDAPGDVWSWIHPYLLAGYGATDADFLRARMLVLLAHDHLEAGRTGRCRHTLEVALKLDPEDAVAARELRRVSD